MPDILAFFGLSMDRWMQGFATRDDIFAWLATSPFIHVLAARYRSPEYEASRKDRPAANERPMRVNFVNYLLTHALPDAPGPDQPEAALYAVQGNVEEKVQAALRFFGKAEEHAALLYAGRAQKHAKELLNGTNVNAWTGVCGKPIRFVMDEVKERLSRLPEAEPESAAAATAPGVEAWQRALLHMEEEELQKLVVTVKDELEKDGRLEFDWRAAKAAKLEKKQQQRIEKASAPVETAAATAVAVA